MSTKLDGVRCLACIDITGEVTYWSRNQKQFHNFDVFTQALAKIFQDFPKPIWVDGEVCMKGGRDFSKVMTQLRRINDMDPSEFVFHIFDIINPNAPQVFDDRWCDLEYICPLVEGFDNIEKVNHARVPPSWRVKEIQGEAEMRIDKYGQEGLVLKDGASFYEQKKSVSWCKVIKNHTEDLPVLSVVPGEGKHEGRMGALMCDYNGHPVKVGTGFSDEERKEFYENPPKMIEVSYREKTKAGSLRFPAFKRVREDK